VSKFFLILPPSHSRNLTISAPPRVGPPLFSSANPTTMPVHLPFTVLQFEAKTLFVFGLDFPPLGETLRTFPHVATPRSPKKVAFLPEVPSVCCPVFPYSIFSTQFSNRLWLSGATCVTSYDFLYSPRGFEKQPSSGFTRLFILPSFSLLLPWRNFLKPS